MAAPSPGSEWVRAGVHKLLMKRPAENQGSFSLLIIVAFPIPEKLEANQAPGKPSRVRPEGSLVRCDTPS